MGSPPAGSPIWNITGAAWVDYAPNTRFAIYSPGPSPTPEVVWDKETGVIDDSDIFGITVDPGKPEIGER